MAPINVFMYIFSKIPTTPYININEYPEIKYLIENWKIIRDEALFLHNEGNITDAKDNDDIGFNSFFKRGWKRFYLTWYGTIIPSALRTCPRTIELISNIECIKGAMFAYLPKNSVLGKHRDPYAGSIRFHLGLKTPNDPNCFIDVDGKRYIWKDGEGVLFDETYLHYVENNTDHDRLIFMCDIERKMSNKIASYVNSMFNKIIMSATVAKNIEDDPIGGINSFFKKISFIVEKYEYYRKKLKKNPFYYKIYYLIKYGLLIVLLYYCIKMI